MQLAHTYLFNRWQAASAAKEQKKVYDSTKADKSELLSYIKANGETDADGSVTFTFPEPLGIGTETITGLKYQRGQTPSSIDTDAVQKYARKHDLEYRLTKAVFTVDGFTSENLQKIDDFITNLQDEVMADATEGAVEYQVKQEWDYDRLYVLNQQGLIPDKVLTKFLVEHPEDVRYALVVVKD
jgi:hypothetical protein